MYTNNQAVVSPCD